MARKRRFYRPPPPLSDLPRLVWSEKYNKAIAEFGKNDDRESPNQFVTESEEIAEILVAQGYKEVSMEAEAPPYVPEMVPEEIGDIKPMPKGFTESHAVQKIKRESLLKKAEEVPPVPEKKKTVAPKKRVAAAKPVDRKPASSKKVLKRRVKK